MTTAMRSTRPAPAPARGPRPTEHRRPSDEHLRVVRQPAGRGRRLAVGVLVVGVVFGSLLCAAVFQSMLVTGQDHLDETRREIAATEQALQRDRARLAAVESPEHLALEAARLGMVEPQGRDWVQADPGIDPATVDATPAEPTDGSTGAELAAPPGPEQEVAAAR